jgi:hypothetical protein
MAPPAGSLPLPRWAWVPLLVPYRPGTPAYKLQAKTRNRVYISALPCAATCCHVSHGSELSLPAREGSGAATCPMAMDNASLLVRALMMPCAPQLQTPSHCSGGLWCCHVPRGSGSHLPAWEDSDCDTPSVTVVAIVFK